MVSDGSRAKYVVQRDAGRAKHDAVGGGLLDARCYRDEVVPQR
jgi:hypothetical protein